MTTIPAEQSQPKPQRRPRLIDQLEAAWRGFRRDLAVFSRNWLAVTGVLVILGFGLMALAHPILLEEVWPLGVYHPMTGYDVMTLPWPSGPSEDHLLGVDVMGRDVLSQLMAGAAPAFTVAFYAGLSMAITSTLIATLSAAYRGPIDTALSAISNVALMLPTTIVMVVIGARFYSEIDVMRFGLFYGLLAGIGPAAVVLRGQALSLMQRPFIDAARVAGAGTGRIIMTHLIPHLMPYVLVNVMVTVAGAVIADGFLAFFGLTNTRLNWGLMVYNGIIWLRMNPTIPWSQIAAPTAALSLFAAAFYFVARGLQDVADPRLQGR